MATPSRLEAAISKIITISSTAAEAELEQALAACMSEALGVETVHIRSDISQGSSGLVDYVLNTKRAFVDNELSEYSQFPELWTEGPEELRIHTHNAERKGRLRNGDDCQSRRTDSQRRR